MSWNASFSSRAAFESDTPTASSPTLPEIQASKEIVEQYIAARQAAELILRARAVVDADDPAVPTDVQIHVSGHANPGHKPTPGWSNDCISISIAQISPVAPT